MPEPHDPYALWRNPPDSNDPPPPPPDGDPPPSDGPIVPDEPPPVVDVGPPEIDIGVPDINISIPDIGIPDIGLPDVGLPDIGVPGIELGLPGASDGAGVGVNAGGDGIGGLLAGDGEGLSLVNLNGDDDTDAVIDLGVPIASEGSAEIGGDGGHINLGSDGDLLDLGGEDLGLIAINSDTDSPINIDVQNGQGGDAHDLGSLINAAMLDIGGTGVTDALALGDAYDGNVPLVGDLSSALEMTLDHLTASPSLFDVPVLDVLSLDALDS